MIRLTFIFPFLLLLISCGTKTPPYRITTLQWELFSYLPYNTEYLFYSNLNELRNSRIGLENSVPDISKNTSGSWLNKFEEETGVGINSGISEIIIAGTDDNKRILLFRVENNYDRVKNYLNRSPGFIKNEIENRETYSPKENPAAQIYLPENSILLITSEKSYIESLFQNYSKRLNENENFISIIRNIDSKSHTWMAADDGTLASELFSRLSGKDSKLLSPKILSSVNNVTLSADFSDGIQVESVLGCSTPGNAYLIASAVEGAKAMNILSDKNVKLGKIFHKMDIKREGKLIRLHLPLTENELKELKLISMNNNQVIKF